LQHGERKVRMTNGGEKKISIWKKKRPTGKGGGRGGKRGPIMGKQKGAAYDFGTEDQKTVRVSKEKNWDPGGEKKEKC